MADSLEEEDSLWFKDVSRQTGGRAAWFLVALECLVGVTIAILMFQTCVYFWGKSVGRIEVASGYSIANNIISCAGGCFRCEERPYTVIVDKHGSRYGPALITTWFAAALAVLLLKMIGRRFIMRMLVYFVAIIIITIGITFIANELFTCIDSVAAVKTE